MKDAVRDIGRRAESEREAYAAGEPRPLGSYGVLVAVYTAGVTLAGVVARRRKVTLPERVHPADLAMVAVATHRLSRLLTKDTVTSVARAPFTKFEGPAGEGEVNEAVRGVGLKHAIGELLTCPFCIAQWIATAFAFGMLFAPRATRMAAAVLTAVTASDWLQFAHAALVRTDQPS